jgi:tetratricopeptide (TPR) repeat protein
MLEWARGEAFTRWEFFVRPNLVRLRPIMATAGGNTDLLSPAVRRRLEQQYERGKQNTQTGNFEYATELLTQCVVGDPGNQTYTEAFLTNLHRKYSSSKKGGLLSSIRTAGSTAGSKTSMMNASRKKDWLGLIKTGLEVLKVNPCDTSALLQMAHACAEMEFVECQLVYLKTAQSVDPKSFEIQRECGLALEKVGQLEKAVSCWMKAEALAKVASLEAQEAHKAISKLQVNMTIGTNVAQDKAKEESNTPPTVAEKAFQAAMAMLKPSKRNHTDELEEKIAANPGELLLYAELADLHVKAEKWNEAESVLARGLDATGGDLRVREQLEDIQLRRARQQAFVTHRQAAEQKTPELKQQAQQLAAELNRLELDVYRKRVERYPTNTHWKFELGVRLILAGNISEAIKMLQDARNDPKHRGHVMLNLGLCFQKIKQFKLAKQHYVQAVEAIPEKEVESRKMALYRAAVLSYGLAEADKNGLNEEELDEAEKYFTQLAALDFGYQNVSQWLDKIVQLRDKG